MHRRNLLMKRPSSGAFDPTSISGCVSWIDLSDNTYMTFTGSAVDTFTDKVNGAVHSKVSSSTEYQWATTHLIKLDPMPRYNSIYSSPITCNDYTFIVMININVSIVGGSIYSNEAWTSNRYLSRNAGNNYRWRPTAGSDLYSTGMPIGLPFALAITGGLTESGVKIYFDNTIDASDTQVKGISLGTSINSFGVTLASSDVRYYQVIVYDRVLTSGEMTDIHAWLATKV